MYLSQFILREIQENDIFKIEKMLSLVCQYQIVSKRFCPIEGANLY